VLTWTANPSELLAGSMWNLLHDKSVRLDWKLQHKLLLDTAKGMVRDHALLVAHTSTYNLL
jgi:hypothetical protein